MISVRPQRGFGLVEMMIALVIGLIIMLGAGQVLLSGIQSFQRIEELSDKQVALLFASDVLVRDVRSAKSIQWNGDADELSLVGSDDVTRVYSLGQTDGQDTWSLYLQEGVGTPQPIVSGFSGEEAFSVTEPADGIDGFYEFTFQLSGADGDETVVFHAMNRTEAVGSSSEP